MDGRDYFEVRAKGKKAIERVRAGEGPGLIHAIVTRPYSHSLSDDQRKYRTPEELAEEQEYDPIDQLERELVEAGILSEDEPRRSGRRRRSTSSRSGARKRSRRRVPIPPPCSITSPVRCPDVVEADEGRRTARSSRTARRSV